MVESPKYLIVVERTLRGFTAYSPHLPGRVVSGTSRSQVEQSMQETIERHLEGIRARGIVVGPARFSSTTGRLKCPKCRTPFAWWRVVFGLSHCGNCRSRLQFTSDSSLIAALAFWFTYLLIGWRFDYPWRGILEEPGLLAGFLLLSLLGNVVVAVSTGRLELHGDRFDLSRGHGHPRPGEAS
jgi:predicted RNase H-like HicB family nuclease